MQRASGDYVVGADLKVGPYRSLPSRVSIQQIANPAENRAFLAAASANAWNRFVDAPGQAAQRQRLQPHASGPGERCEKEPFASEQRGLDTADELNVVTD